MHSDSFFTDRPLKMNEKNNYHLAIVLLVLLLMIGCAPVYKLHHYNGNAIKGWVIISHNAVYTAFTADEHGILPEDEKLAMSRFERRKDFVQKYYNIQHPGTIALKQLPLLPVGIVLFPVFIVDEYAEHVFGLRHEMSDEERDKFAKKVLAEEKILKDFIVTDMQQERTTPHGNAK